MTRPIAIAFIIALLAELFTSCSAEKRLNKLLALHPELHDTIIVRDTVRLVTVGVQHDTTFLPVPADTVRIDEGRMHVRYVKLAGDTVWLQGKCDPDTVTKFIEHTVDRIGPTRTITKDKVPWWVYVLCGGLLLITVLTLTRK